MIKNYAGVHLNKSKINLGIDAAEKITSDLSDKLGFDKLPEEVIISTMTLTCKLDVNFNCRNIARFVDITYDGILSVKCGNDEDSQTNRSLLPKKQKNPYICTSYL